jgi:putative transposase
MPECRRMRVAGGRYFLTVVTEKRRPLFEGAAAVGRLRASAATARAERPFAFRGAVVLPDHFHWLIELPPGDSDYSTRMGRIKALFTKSIPAVDRPNDPITASRRRRREQMIWQRRFWEHTIRDERDFAAHLDYIHYNPVKHGYVRCPHAWPWSSYSSPRADGLVRCRLGLRVRRPRVCTTRFRCDRGAAGRGGMVGDAHPTFLFHLLAGDAKLRVDGVAFPLLPR